MKATRNRLRIIFYPINEGRIVDSLNTSNMENNFSSLLAGHKAEGFRFSRLNINEEIVKQRKINKQQFIELSRQLSFLVNNSFKESETPLVIGGDSTFLLGLMDGIRRFSGLCSIVSVSQYMGLLLKRGSNSLSRAIIAHLLGEGEHSIYAFSPMSPILDGRSVVLCGWRKASLLEKHLAASLGVFSWSLKELKRNRIKGIYQTIYDTAASAAKYIHIHIDSSLVKFDLQEGIDKEENYLSAGELSELLLPFQRCEKFVSVSLSGFHRLQHPDAANLMRYITDF